MAYMGHFAGANSYQEDCQEDFQDANSYREDYQDGDSSMNPSGLYANGYAPQQQPCMQWPYPDQPFNTGNQSLAGLDNPSNPQHGPLTSWSMDSDEPWAPVGLPRQRTLPDSQEWNELPMGDVPRTHDSSGWIPSFSDGHEGMPFCGTVSIPADLGGPVVSTGSAFQRSLRVPVPNYGRNPYPANLEVYQDQSQPPLATEVRDPLSVASSQQHPLLCPTCKEVCKSKAILRKHDDRHKKPYLCPHNCPKSRQGEGFGTNNDLQRHIRSRHLPKDAHYTCTLNSCGKTFPRTDNWRAHMEKTHRLSKEEAKNIAKNTELSMANQANQGSADPTFDNFDNDGEVYQCYEPQSKTKAHMVSSDPQESQDFDPSEERSPFFRSYGRRQAYSSQMQAASNLDIGRDDDRPWTLPVAGGLAPLDPRFVLPGRIIGIDTASAMASQNVVDKSFVSSQEAYNGYSTPDFAQGNSSSSSLPPSEKKIQMQRPCQSSRSSRDRSPLRIIQEALGEDNFGNAAHISHPYSPDGARKEQRWIAENSLLHPNSRSFPGAHRNLAHRPAQGSNLGNAGLVLEKLQAEYNFVKKEPTSSSPRYSELEANEEIAGSPEEAECATCSSLQSQNKLSELRKHMKRHSRPYFCINNNCSKTFGSKNDWTRHCNSQHLHYEQWVCAAVVEGLGGRTCDWATNHPDSLKTHLAKVHGSPFRNMKDAMRSMRVVDDQFPQKFWCGGECKQWIGLKGEPDERWDGRWNHIEDHILGRKGEVLVTAKTWTPEPHGGPRPVGKILDCRMMDKYHAPLQGRSDAGSSAAMQRPSFGSTQSAPEPLESFHGQKRHASNSPDTNNRTGLKKPKPEDSQPRKRDGGREYRNTRSHRSINTVTTSCCECGNLSDQRTCDRCVSCNHVLCQYCDREAYAVDAEDNRRDMGGDGGGYDGAGASGMSSQRRRQNVEL